MVWVWKHVRSWGPLWWPRMGILQIYRCTMHKRLKFCSEYWLHAGIIVETIHLLLGDSQCKLKHLRFVLKLLKKTNQVFSISGGLHAADGFHHTSAAKPIHHRFHSCYMTEVKSTQKIFFLIFSMLIFLCGNYSIKPHPLAYFSSTLQILLLQIRR